MEVKYIAVMIESAVAEDGENETDEQTNPGIYLAAESDLNTTQGYKDMESKCHAECMKRTRLNERGDVKKARVHCKGELRSRRLEREGMHRLIYWGPGVFFWP